MKEITSDNILYAIHEDGLFMEGGSVWFGDPERGLQIQRMCYHEGKTFQLHRHVKRPRKIEHTEECFVVLQGNLSAKIYNDDKVLIADLILREGDMLVCYRGWHEFKVLEDYTVCFEIKNGPYSGEDKEWSK